MQSQAEPAQAAIKTMSKPTPCTTPAPAANKLDPIAVLREELAAAAVCHGVERVEDLTEELVRRYVQRLGGVKVYVPVERSLARTQMMREIRANFDGRNGKELARKFGVSLRQVQRVIAGDGPS